MEASGHEAAIRRQRPLDQAENGIQRDRKRQASMWSGRVDDDITQLLAAEIGLSLEAFLNAAGGHWTTVSEQLIAEQDSAFPDARWYVSGEPAQVLLGVAAEQLVVATPTGEW